jgi:hypothetical protein
VRGRLKATSPEIERHLTELDKQLRADLDPKHVTSDFGGHPRGVDLGKIRHHAEDYAEKFQGSIQRLTGLPPQHGDQ